MILKRDAISNYMFYLAFENSIEVGYVTEKLFDGLIAGTVPVFLGSAEDAKKLIPHPKSVIFLEDFKNDAWGMFDAWAIFDAWGKICMRICI